MELIRKGNDVFFNGRKLVLNPQATKGPNKEVVKIEGLEGSNGQKWYSLTKLKEGSNIIECQGREVTTSSSPRHAYILTEAETKEVAEYQSAIDQIIENAKARYVKVPNLKADTSSMTPIELAEYIKSVEAYIASIKA